LTAAPPAAVPTGWLKLIERLGGDDEDDRKAAEKKHSDPRARTRCLACAREPEASATGPARHRQHRQHRQHGEPVHVDRVDGVDGRIPESIDVLKDRFDPPEAAAAAAPG
jgi:hypothetical protein